MSFKIIVRSVAVILPLFIFFSPSAASSYGNPHFRVPKEPPVSSYTMDVIIDAKNGTLKGTQEINLTNTSNLALEVIAIDWRVDETRKIELTAEGREPVILYDDRTGDHYCTSAAGFFRMFSGKSEPASCGIVMARLSKPLLPGQSLRIETVFSASDIFQPGEDNIILVDWFPKLWWDGINTFDSYDVGITVPDDYTLAASGLKQGETGRFVNRGVRSFGIFLGRGLNVKTGSAANVHIYSLHTPGGQEAAEFCLEAAKDAIEFYTEWLGFYPFDFLYIIPGRYSHPAGGYPVASGIVAIHGQENFDRAPHIHWQWITAHEIGHQYWGEYVMDGDDPAWLWIGLGIYADREFLKHYNLPEDKIREIIDRYVNSYYRNIDTSIDLPPHMVREIDYDYNNIVVHGKGFAIVSALSYYMGKEEFGRLYKRCLDEFGGREMGYKDLWDMAVRQTGENLSWFFEQWVRSDRYLSCHIDSVVSMRRDNGYVTTVKIDCPGSLRMPLPVTVYFEDGTEKSIRTSRLKSGHTLQFISNTPASDVVIDPDGLLPVAKSLSMINDPVELIRLLPWTGKGKEALRAFESADAGNTGDFGFWFKLGLLLFDGEFYEQSLEAFQHAFLFSPDTNFEFACLVWQGHINDLLGNREQALQLYSRSLDYKVTGNIRFDQYRIHMTRDWVLERLEEPFSRTW